MCYDIQLACRLNPVLRIWSLWYLFLLARCCFVEVHLCLSGGYAVRWSFHPMQLNTGSSQNSRSLYGVVLLQFIFTPIRAQWQGWACCRNTCCYRAASRGYRDRGLSLARLSISVNHTRFQFSVFSTFCECWFIGLQIVVGS